MTINLQTLKCSECGSGILERTGLNQYACEHCGSVSLVEDNVSERLDRVLNQVKNEAARRLALEESQRLGTQRHAKIAGIVVGGLALTGFITSIVTKQAFGNRKAQADRPGLYALGESAIPTDGLKLGTPRVVLVGSGSSAQAKLLVTVRNETGKPLQRPMVQATYYAGDNRLGERQNHVDIDVLAPGESAPVLIDLPSQENATRQTVQVWRLIPPFNTAKGPRLAFQRVRLVQQKDNLRLVGRIVNTRQDATLAGCEVLVTLYDDSGAVIGLGHGYAQANEIRPGERSALEVSLTRFGSQAQVAAWDYRINYHVLAAEGGRTQVLSSDRVIRAAGAPESFNPDLRLSTEDLLAEDSERFDPAQLELLPLMEGRDETQQPVYLTELVNRSRDMIAVSPGAVISHFDGNQQGATTPLSGLAYLYPGERYPLVLDPRRADRITQTRIEWKPMRRAALPGPRVPLEVHVTGTRAATSSVLVNFSQRFTYKYAEVSGSIKNPGATLVRKPQLWMSLRDREGRLTGYQMVENLPAIAPGESVPFQAKVKQYGRDFASVGTLYQEE